MNPEEPEAADSLQPVIRSMAVVSSADLVVLDLWVVLRVRVEDGFRGSYVLDLFLDTPQCIQPSTSVQPDTVCEPKFGSVHAQCYQSVTTETRGDTGLKTRESTEASRVQFTDEQSAKANNPAGKRQRQGQEKTSQKSKSQNTTLRKTLERLTQRTKTNWQKERGTHRLNTNR